MTAVTRAITAIEAIVGHTVTQAYLLIIADAYIDQNKYNLANWAGAPTNEEKAELFLLTIEKDGRRVVRSVAIEAAKDAEKAIMRANLDAVGDAAEAVFD